MGKGNRSRIERAMTSSANENKNVKANKKNKVSGAGIFVSITAILVVITLLIGAIGVLNDAGWFARSQTVVETENYRVNGTMMNYFFMTQFNSYYQYYYQLYSAYQSTGLYDSVYDLMGIDPDKSLKDQDMKVAEGADPITVFDYYMNLTEEYVTNMLTYCEFATKEGITLTEEDYEEIEHSIEHMEENYESQKSLYEQFGMAYYNTFSAYLSATYGTGVKVKDIRACMELSTLASKFAEKLNDETEAEILSDETREAIEQYVKDNPANFLMADYYSYQFSVTSKNYENDADFEAAKAEILEKAKKLAEVEGKDAYKAAVLELLKESELETYREKNWSTFLKENDNDETKAEEALLKKFNESEWTEARQTVKFDATLTTGYKYPTTLTDLSKWVFGYDAGEHTDDCDHEGEHEKDQEAAKKGDITYFENTTEKEETIKTETTTAATTEETTEGAAKSAETTTEEQTTGSSSTSTSNKVKVTTYTVTVHLLEKETYRDTQQTEKFGYALFTSKEDAEKFHAEFTAQQTKDLDTLIDVLDHMHEEITVSSYDAVENYVPGTVKKNQSIEGVDSWLETAKAGDVSAVTEVVKTTTTTKDGETQETKTTYYAVMVYEGQGYEAWFYNALVGATTVAVNDWYDENGLELTYNEKAYKYIDM